jgi:cell division protein ZipA
MLESLFSLRLLLFFGGGLFVVGIYFFGRRKSRQNMRIKYASRRARFEPRRKGKSEAGLPAEARLINLNEDPHSRADYDDNDVVVVDIETPALNLPTITREGKTADKPESAKRKDLQMELTFEQEAVAETHSDVTEAIISLYVRPPEGHQFAGTAIVGAMNSVGLRFGDMDIFHHFGAGDLRVETPLFSVANMVEPGSFDLTKTDSFTTPGLALFLQLPGPLDGAVTFELFLNTGQRLTEALSGDLYGEPKRLLDATMIDSMRRTALPFANGDE